MMKPDEQIFIDKKAQEQLRHNLTNSLSIITLSLKALKKRSDKEIQRIEMQVDRIENAISRLSTEKKQRK